MELEEWFEGRPKWLQTAAELRRVKAVLSETDYQKLFDLCRREAENVEFLTTCPWDSFQVSVTGATIQL